MITRLPLFAVSLGTLTLAMVSSTSLPTQYLPIYGGGGGTAFTRNCGNGSVMVGLRLRSGMAMDAMGLLCRQVKADGSLASETTVGTMAGGGGGSSSILSCGASDAVVAGAKIRHTGVISSVSLLCKKWSAKTRAFVAADFTYAGPGGGAGIGGRLDEEKCEAGTQPAAGIRGRSGVLVDAVGLFCDEP